MKVLFSLEKNCVVEFVFKHHSIEKWKRPFKMESENMV